MVGDRFTIILVNLTNGIFEWSDEAHQENVRRRRGSPRSGDRATGGCARATTIHSCRMKNLL